MALRSKSWRVFLWWTAYQWGDGDSISGILSWTRYIVSARWRRGRRAETESWDEEHSWLHWFLHASHIRERRWPSLSARVVWQRFDSCATKGRMLNLAVVTCIVPVHYGLVPSTLRLRVWCLSSLEGLYHMCVQEPRTRFLQRVMLRVTRPYWLGWSRLAVARGLSEISIPFLLMVPDLTSSESRTDRRRTSRSAPTMLPTSPRNEPGCQRPSVSVPVKLMK